MKATYLSVVTLALLGACATQEDAPSGLCNPRSADCNVVAGAPGAGAAGANTAGSSSGGGAGAGAAGSAQAGAAQAGSAQGGAAQGGGGAAQGGAPSAGAPQGGAPQAGAPQGGAPSAGAPQGGAPSAGAGGAPATGRIVIRTNRDKGGQRWYVKLVAPNNHLSWSAATVAEAEKFEQVSTGTNQIKLRATSVNKYIALDQTVAAAQSEQH